MWGSGLRGANGYGMPWTLELYAHCLARFLSGCQHAPFPVTRAKYAMYHVPYTLHDRIPYTALPCLQYVKRIGFIGCHESVNPGFCDCDVLTVIAVC